MCKSGLQMEADPINLKKIADGSYNPGTQLTSPKRWWARPSIRAKRRSPVGTQKIKRSNRFFGYRDRVCGLCGVDILRGAKYQHPWPGLWGRHSVARCRSPDRRLQGAPFAAVKNRPPALIRQRYLGCRIISFHDAPAAGGAKHLPPESYSTPSR